LPKGKTRRLIERTCATTSRSRGKATPRCCSRILRSVAYRSFDSLEKFSLTTCGKSRPKFSAKCTPTLLDYER
jgi:hypothetical protein